MRNDSGSYQDGSSGGYKRWDLGYFLKIKLIGFVNRLNV